MIELNIKFIQLVNKAVIVVFFFAAIFSRSFMGIYIFGFRIGELFVALSLFLFFYLILYNFKFVEKSFSKMMKASMFLILLYFFVLLNNTEGEYFALYTYKSSSYIWTLSFLILGLIVPKFKMSLKKAIIFEIIFMFIYFTSVFGYPVTLINFFSNFSDKFEPHKGSDLALVYILLLFFLLDLEDVKQSFYIYIVNSSLFFPLLLFRSRTAFFACVIVFLFAFLKYLSNLNLSLKEIITIVSLSLVLLTFSTINCQIENIEDDNPIPSDSIINSYSNLAEYRLKHFNSDLPLIFFNKGRVYSGDGNLNWRLDMWQDQLEDQFEDGNLLSGSGFNKKFRIFTENNTGYGNDRRGLDDLNEHLHNYFLNILSRGGVFHLIIYFSIYLFLLIHYKNKYKKVDIYFYIIPILLVSSFDSSMENSHFPLIFYYYLGNLFFAEEKTIN